MFYVWPVPDNVVGAEMRALLWFVSTRVSSCVVAANGAWTMEVTSAVCPVNVCMHSPVVELQTLQVESTDKVITKASSKEKMAVRTRPASPIKVVKRSPVVELQLFTVPSSEAVSAEVPSDENTAETTAC